MIHNSDSCVCNRINVFVGVLFIVLKLTSIGVHKKYHLSTHLYDQIYFDRLVQFHPSMHSDYIFWLFASCEGGASWMRVIRTDQP